MLHKFFKVFIIKEERKVKTKVALTPLQVKLLMLERKKRREMNKQK